MGITEILELLRCLAAEHAAAIRVLALASLAFFLVTPVLAPALIVLMPADVLVRPRRRLKDRPVERRILYLAWHVFKNILGTALMLLGFILLFMPGQGLLTIFVGLLMADVPGKRRLLARLLGAGKVRPAVDRLRARYRRDEMAWPENVGRSD